MKKMLVIFATLIMSLGFVVSVMAAPSPDDKPWIDPDDPSATTTEVPGDNDSKIKKDKFYDDDKDDGNGNGNGSKTVTTTSSSASPKTGDQGAPVSLVYASLAAAALAVYAAKHVKEQY